MSPTSRPPSARLRVTLLGGFEVLRRDGSRVALPHRKTRALLAFLAATRGRAHSREALASLLWGERSDDAARTSLRQALFHLRRGLARAAACLAAEGRDRVGLAGDAVEVDAIAFERLTASDSLKGLEQAAGLYRGDLLAGLGVDEPGWEDWLRQERERLRALAVRALERLAALQERTGAGEAAVRTAQQLLSIDPLQEHVHRSLVRLYLSAGRREAALRQYQACVEILQRELGVEPEPETRAVYRQALGAAPGGGGEEAPEGATARPLLVGRVEERRRLAEALDATWAGRGGTVLILGEAGIGKSCLVATLRADALKRGGHATVGHAHESERVLPFAPWSEALVRLLPPGGPRALGRGRRRAEPGSWTAPLAALWPSADAASVAARVGPAEHRPVFDAVLRLLRHLAERQPLVVGLEDLQWADEMALRLLAFLARRVGDAPVLLVGTARSEDLADSPLLPHLAREIEDAGGHRIELGPLGRAEAADLTRALGGRRGADPALVRRVWALSRGHPLAIVESLRATARDASLATQARLPVPERVRRLIGERLERLSAPGRVLAGAAAVLGGPASFEVVRETAGLREKEAADALEELVRRRVLLQGHGDAFGFSHDLIREVVYDGLLLPRRRLLHRRAAAAIADRRGGPRGPQAAALGRHYLLAEAWAPAVHALRLAGDEALRRGAPRVAVRCFEEALAALAHLPEREDTVALGVEVRLGLVETLGDVARIARRLGEALALAERLGDEGLVGRVSASMAYTHYWLGQPTPGLEAGERALGIARRLGDARLEVLASHHLGLICLIRGEYRRMLELQEQIAACLPRAGVEGLTTMLHWPEVSWRSWAGICRAFLGDFAGARQATREAVGVAQGTGHTVTRAFANQCVGWVSALGGDFGEAMTWLSRSRAAYLEAEAAPMLPAVDLALGASLALAGRPDEALPFLTSAEQEARRRQLHFIHAGSLVVLGEARALAGEVAGARALVEEAVTVARERGYPWIEAEALRVLGEVSGLTPDRSASAEAERALASAIALAERMELRPLAARARLALGQLHARSGHAEAARVELGRARRELEALAITGWAAKAEAAHAALPREGGPPRSVTRPPALRRRAAALA